MAWPALERLGVNAGFCSSRPGSGRQSSADRRASLPSDELNLGRKSAGRGLDAYEQLRRALAMAIEELLLVSGRDLDGPKPSTIGRARAGSWAKSSEDGRSGAWFQSDDTLAAQGRGEEVIWSPRHANIS